jgi:glycine betaine/proline transport system substrate-binding protein
MTKTKTLSAILGAGILAVGVHAQTVKIAYPNWAEGIAMTNLMAAVLEEEMGYDVELTTADPGVIYSAVAAGDQDLFLDAWLPNTHEPYWEEYGDQLESLGTTFGNAITGLVVPTYMQVDSIDQLNSIASDLDNKIIGIGTGAGIYRATNAAINEYDLELVQVSSSGPAMTAALGDAIENNEPIVITGWKPHWMFGRYDLKVLDDPLGVYPIDGCRKVARPGFQQDMPEVAELMLNFTMTEEQLLDLMIAIDDSDADPRDVASDWMRSNQPVVDSWIPRS